MYVLDQIVLRDYPEGARNLRNFTERVAVEEVGGTCGNVMCMMAHLGWKAFPQVSLDESAQGLKMAEDLRHYGCDTRFVTNDANGGATLLRCTHKLDKEGKHKISFYATATDGGRFPKHHFLRARDEAPEFLGALDFVPDVYFFDVDAPGHRAIAKELRQRGSLVYFEPEKTDRMTFYNCIELSDIIKFSNVNVPDVSFVERYPGKLFIQTMGADGVRFFWKGQWTTVPPVPCENVVDWEGAGDWTTSAFLTNLLDDSYRPGDFSTLTTERIAEALAKAQAVASKSIGYLSSKGIIHAGQI